jgi:hypothetical protein
MKVTLSQFARITTEPIRPDRICERARQARRING